MKRYLLHRMENMRDIGGYKTPQGIIPFKKLVRSNMPALLSDNDKIFLKQQGITTIIDLRSPEEYQTKISSFENDLSFQLFHCPSVVGRAIPATAQDVPVSYLNISGETENIRDIFTIISQAPGGVLYFCSAGKDRTGVITALLLHFLGVATKDIAADYALTGDFLAKTLAEVIARSERDIADIIIPKPAFIETFLTLFTQKYGSINHYLTHIGFLPNQQKQLKEKLLQPL